MRCAICDTTDDLVRLNCGLGLHYLCVDCNNKQYNTPLRGVLDGRDLPGTHDKRCPLCRAESVAPVDRTMVPRQTRLLLARTAGVTVNRYVPPPPGLYDGLPAPLHG